MSRDDHEYNPKADRARDSVKNRVRKEKDLRSLDDYAHAFGGAYQVTPYLAMLFETRISRVP
ncbi:hypothetical protein ColTof4_06843 [Colletotrichum tofieldiae]|nr:hypothetical protein ColTof3_11789 [Colletotrichum tofieldiae]GKT74420.1 hypothetical protein ColTof4_06843 [Colletotrichum tofieldiae]